MIPVFRSSLFLVHKSHGIGYGMNSVGTAASKKLGVITSADKVNNTVPIPMRRQMNLFRERDQSFRWISGLHISEVAKLR